MSCEICRSSACTRSFHSLEQQELFDEYEYSGGDLDFYDWLDEKDNEAQDERD